jgi:hypothetical protein
MAKDIEQILKDSMFMKGGNTDNEKNYYSQGFLKCYRDHCLPVVEERDELKRENKFLKEALEDLKLIKNRNDETKM